MFYNNFKWSIIYKNTDSLCCTPKTNIILKINCTSTTTKITGQTTRINKSGKEPKQ